MGLSSDPGSQAKQRQKSRFFANFCQFLARCSAVPQPIWPKLSPDIAPTSPTIPLKFEPDRPRWGRAASQAVGEKSRKSPFFVNFRQFLARSSAVPHPIWPNLSPNVAPTSPTNPLKFQPDWPRWGRAAIRTVGRNSAENRVFPLICGSFSPVTRTYLNRSGRFQKYAFPEGSRSSPENFSQNGSRGSD